MTDAHKVMFIDISQSHLHSEGINPNLYVELPAEMNVPSHCGYLKKASIWDVDCVHVPV